MTIFYDSEAFFVRSTASQTVLPTPENVRDVPCDGCPNARQCETDTIECKAFRNWCAAGDFEDADIGRLMRKPKAF